tara:strand:- start:1943 stop:3376 length:1434 start_codon:yes stop_codon:yes gene_type:complete
MMKRIADFFKKLFSSPIKRMPTDRLFADWGLLQYEHLFDHFEVNKTARQNAESNSPASSATKPDTFHNVLFSRYEKIVSDKTLEITSHLDSLETRSEKALEKVNFLNDIKTQFKNKLDQDLEVFQPIITNANSRAKSSKIELNEFKTENGLTRDASYPDSKVWFIFVLVALVVVESLINGVMFQKGSASGYLGGISIAILISLINVVVGFLVGAYWGKLSWSIHQAKKIFGYMGFAVWSVFTISFNLSVGHVRTIFEQGGSAPGVEIWTQGFINFLNSPFGLVDFFSWLLVIIGTLFALVALIDGQRFDDKYPGYGREFRKLLDAEAELQSEVQNLNFNADNFYNEFLSKGDSAIKDLGSDARDLRSKYDFVEVRINTEYPKYCEYYSSLFSRLINDYRNINIENRSDDAPSYFSVDPEFTWTVDNRESQLRDIDSQLKDISEKLSLNTEKWAEDRRELESIKIQFLEEIRTYDSVS